MNELTKVWYLLSFSFGCWTCLNCLLNRNLARPVKWSILAFIGLLLLPPLNAYVTLVRHGPLPWLQTISFQLTWAYGPLLVLVIRHSLLQTTRHALWHAVPLLTASALTLLQPAWLNPLWFLALLFIQVSAYLTWAACLLVQHRARIKQLANQHQNSSYYWLLFLAGGLMAATLMDIVIYICILTTGIASTTLISAAASALALYVNTIALFAMYQPAALTPAAAEAPAKPVEVTPPCRIIELSPQAAKELDQQLMALVASHQPHLDEDISLGKLASLLAITTHQLSELLNIHKETSFYDFLNELRFQESLKLLENGQEDVTIADIAYRSGFNNRNTFYKVFKDKTGVTPGQYKKKSA